MTIEDRTAGGEPITLNLSGRRGDAGLARGFLAEILPVLGWQDRLDDACLLITELIANVALHAHTACTVTVNGGDDVLQIEVKDASPAMPRVQNFSLEATTGRGLRLVESLSDAWGVNPVHGGKVVWFCLGRTQPTLGGGPEAQHQTTGPPSPVDLDALLAQLPGWPDDDRDSPSLLDHRSLVWN